MAVYVVTWNLNRESNYANARAELIKLLDTYPSVADAGLESVRWIETNKSATEVSLHLRTKLDNNDRLFVSKLAAGTRDGWLHQTTWDWINARV